MSGAASVMVVALAVLAAVPAFPQEKEAVGATGQAMGKAAAGFGADFDDDKPASEKNQSSLDQLGDVPATRPPQDGGKAADAAKAVVEGAVAAAPQIPAAEPQAAPIKQEIQAALERHDEPAARQLMSRALQRFPNDPELKDARSSLWSRLPEGKAQAIISSAQTEAAKLFGHQWIPGSTSGEEVDLSIEKGQGRGTQMFGGGAVTGAVKKGYAYIDRGDTGRAEQVLSQALRKHADSAELYYARAIARGLSGNLKGADGDSLRAVTLSREQPIVLSQRASLMMEMGRRDEAFAWANRALEGDPKNADALAIRGRYLWRDQGRPELALDDLRHAAQLDPEHYQTLFQEGQRRYYGQRATASLSRGDYRQAFINSGLALQADPGNVQAHLVRGMVYWKMGKSEDTIKDATLALKADPKSTWALFQRGLAMESLGRRDFAIADFKRAALLKPTKFRPLLDRLLQAQREGRIEPVWPREGGVASAVSN